MVCAGVATVERKAQRRSARSEQSVRMHVCRWFPKVSRKGELMNKTASNARLKASLEELAGLGSPVDLSVVDMEVENEKVEIEQVGGMLESHIFQLQNRGSRTNFASRRTPEPAPRDSELLGYH